MCCRLRRRRESTSVDFFPQLTQLAAKNAGLRAEVTSWPLSSHLAFQSPNGTRNPCYGSFMGRKWRARIPTAMASQACVAALTSTPTALGCAFLSMALENVRLSTYKTLLVPSPMKDKQKSERRLLETLGYRKPIHFEIEQ